MSARRAWYLNLDAEDELLRRGSVTPSRAVAARCVALASRLAGLVPEGDAVLHPGAEATRSLEGCVGLAWCPTPSALRALARCGARVPEAPSWEALRAANHRALSASIAQPLPGAAYVRTEGDLAALLREGSPTGAWLLKRPLGYRGNGRLRVRGDEPDAQTWRWIRASLAGAEGLQVEPEVERIEDHGRHGFLARNGTVTWGALTRQRLDAQGAWAESVALDDGALDADEDRSLRDACERVAEALRGVGYFGPFGVDAFRWRDPQGRARYNPLCEVNARYSMGWAVGMRGRRVDLA